MCISSGNSIILSPAFLFSFFLLLREEVVHFMLTGSENPQVTGPVSIAAYMRQCLTSPDGGYYISRGQEDEDTALFGAKGDFVTSPEISQIFGELLGVWTVTEWMGQGRKSGGVQIIEFGPGKGTLMGDMLRVGFFFFFFFLLGFFCRRSWGQFGRGRLLMTAVLS